MPETEKVKKVLSEAKRRQLETVKFPVGHKFSFKPIDFKLLDRLIKYFCTEEECAGILNVTPETLNNRLKDVFGMTFTEYFARKSADSKKSLRRRQFEMAHDNVVMSIWLGKQVLGQTDRVETKVEHNISVIQKVRDLISANPDEPLQLTEGQAGEKADVIDVKRIDDAKSYQQTGWAVRAVERQQEKMEKLEVESNATIQEGAPALQGENKE